MENTRVADDAVQLTAVYTQGKLLLGAAGTKASCAERVHFVVESPASSPPRFALCHDPGPTPPPQAVVTPYQIVTLFAVEAPPEEVVVVHHGLPRRVPVLVAADPVALDRREPVDLVRLTSRRYVGELPAAFAELLGTDGEPVPPPIVWPMRLGPLFDGRLERAPANPRRATGYSDRFDFTEAFLDAVKSLPADTHGGIDKLTTIHVTETGALFGGMGSFQRLFVSVLAY